MMWKEEEGFLTRVFEFANFIDAVAFVNQIVPLAEAMNHHPDIEIFAYKKVKIKLTTHDEKKVTGKDVELAAKIDALIPKDRRFQSVATSGQTLPRRIFQFR